jgi:Concanavalin A-like lectin/glucanases superfamily
VKKLFSLAAMVCFSLLVVGLLAAAGAPAQDRDNDGHGRSLNSGLLAHWRFNEGAGTTTEDSSGNENDGTLLSGTPGGPIPLWVKDTPPIRHDRFALAFDGSQSGPYVQAPTLAISNTLSIAAWVKFAVNPGDDTTQGIVSEPSPGTGWALRMEYAFDNLGNFTPRANFGINNGFINCSVHSIPQLPVGQWTHLAVTYEVHGTVDAGIVKLYMNGEEVPVDTQCPAPGFLPITGEPIDIGREFAPACCGTRTFDGDIDEVRIYDRILGADEVHKLAKVVHKDKDNDDGGDKD